MSKTRRQAKRSDAAASAKVSGKAPMQGEGKPAAVRRFSCWGLIVNPSGDNAVCRNSLALARHEVVAV